MSSHDKITFLNVYRHSFLRYKIFSFLGLGRKDLNLFKNQTIYKSYQDLDVKDLVRLGNGRLLREKLCKFKSLLQDNKATGAKIQYQDWLDFVGGKQNFSKDLFKNQQEIDEFLNICRELGFVTYRFFKDFINFYGFTPERADLLDLGTEKWEFHSSIQKELFLYLLDKKKLQVYNYQQVVVAPYFNECRDLFRTIPNWSDADLLYPVLSSNDHIETFKWLAQVSDLLNYDLYYQKYPNKLPNNQDNQVLQQLYGIRIQTDHPVLVEYPFGSIEIFHFVKNNHPIQLLKYLNNPFYSFAIKDLDLAKEFVLYLKENDIVPTMLLDFQVIDIQLFKDLASLGVGFICPLDSFSTMAFVLESNYQNWSSFSNFYKFSDYKALDSEIHGVLDKIQENPQVMSVCKQTFYKALNKRDLKFVKLFLTMINPAYKVTIKNVTSAYESGSRRLYEYVLAHWTPPQEKTFDDLYIELLKVAIFVKANVKDVCLFSKSIVNNDLVNQLMSFTYKSLSSASGKKKEIMIKIVEILKPRFLNPVSKLDKNLYYQDWNFLGLDFTGAMEALRTSLVNGCLATFKIVLSHMTSDEKEKLSNQIESIVLNYFKTNGPLYYKVPLYIFETFNFTLESFKELYALGQELGNQTLMDIVSSIAKV
ncbi:hypothetical protein CYY_008541 [Polysphondylium violaceum]|uniref:Uncharacterized protein n=1 Tax=Polysphondylium violaceum TaxID=133409 RepID=A0A8J4V159_9MYCE|nr:hypothetical protein CYY_008541 [Polysphondylium violaceum]